MLLSNLSPSVCIDAVFAKKSFDEACTLTKQAGINTIEFWDWWGKDLASLQKAQQKHELNIACCCTKFISLVNASQRENYLQGLQESIAVAKQLNTKILISQVGDFIPNVSREDQTQSLIAGLKASAPLLEAAGITLVIEPLNEKVDHQGYFLIKSSDAFDIIKTVNSPNIKVLFDIYHQQISEGNLIQNMLSNIDYIGHFHAAGHPGRNELQHGEINYFNIFKAIQKSNYQGYVGLEYWPVNEDPVGALNEVVKWLA